MRTRPSDKSLWIVVVLFLQIALEKKTVWKISPVAGHSQRPEQKLRNEVPKALAEESKGVRGFFEDV